MEAKAPERIRVLIVDDEVELGRSIQAYLAQEGFDPIYASELDSALAILDDDLDLDLLITDIYLGQETGKAGGHLLTEAAIQRSPSLPVILLTGKPSMGAALEGLRGHADDFMTKPVNFAELKRRAIGVVENKLLRRRLDELEEVNRMLSSILPAAIEAKDPTTGGHSDRVVVYTDSLARRVGVAAPQRRELRLAALLHDVGKIGIPEAILTKKGPLTSEERLVIQEHPGIGYRILAPLEQQPHVREWVYQHHERWDGAGYPEGLIGEEVALPGRILILAEVFDALATARSYKKAWRKEKIADFFEAEAGRHFDPELGRIVAEGVRHEGVAFFQDGLEGGKQQDLF